MVVRNLVLSNKTYQGQPFRVYTSIKILKINVAIFNEIYVFDIWIRLFPLKLNLNLSVKSYLLIPINQLSNTINNTIINIKTKGAMSLSAEQHYNWSKYRLAVFCSNEFLYLELTFWCLKKPHGTISSSKVKLYILAKSTCIFYKILWSKPRLGHE